MNAKPTKTDLLGLEALALERGGYFRREDAHAYGITDRLLSYHTHTGRFERVLPAVFRIARAPISQLDEFFLAWVWSRYRGAISHESALSLYGLSDLVPRRIQVTVPTDESRRSSRFSIYRSDLKEDEVTFYEGVQTTTPARSIADAAAAGSDPEQIQKAVREGIQRGLFVPDMLRKAVQRKSRNRTMSQRLLELALQE
jgi:predicted transcriptional regulator of viral defense system